MFYTINNTINFRDTDGLIWLDHDEASSIALTTTTSRLLAFLLERQGYVAPRDEILSHVWDAHGLRSSNNSLNKYISDLRNIFRNMGYSEEIIITVPRIGFMFTADVTVEKHMLDHQRQDVPAVPIEIAPPKKHRRLVITISAGLIFFVAITGAKRQPVYAARSQRGRRPKNLGRWAASIAAMSFPLLLLLRKQHS